MRDTERRIYADLARVVHPRVWLRRIETSLSIGLPDAVAACRGDPLYPITFIEIKVLKSRHNGWALQEPLKPAQHGFLLLAARTNRVLILGRDELPRWVSLHLQQDFRRTVVQGEWFESARRLLRYSGLPVRSNLRVRRSMG